MLLIPCPNCGRRDESEFAYGGRAISYPELNASQADWHQAIHLRESSRGEIEEYWYHAGGCECWIRLSRDLLTHEIKTSKTTADEAVS